MRSTAVFPIAAPMNSFTRYRMVDGVAWLTLARPGKRNALTREFLVELRRRVEEAAGDDAVRVLVLDAEGPVFCAGMDLGEMQARATAPDADPQWQADAAAYRDLLVSLVSIPKPTLAVVQGPAVAGGLGLVLACDMVLAADGASFALPEPKRGITAAVVTPLLVYRVGPGQAHRLLLGGAAISAEEAQQIGLCHATATASELATRTEALLHDVLSGSPEALAMTKRHLLATAGSELFEHLERGMLVSAQARATADAREGLSAFLEKRPPCWVR